MNLLVQVSSFSRNSFAVINSAFIPDRTEIPNRPVERVYFVGNGSIPFTLGTSSTTYYSGGNPIHYLSVSEISKL